MHIHCTLLCVELRSSVALLTASPAYHDVSMMSFHVQKRVFYFRLINFKVLFSCSGFDCAIVVVSQASDSEDSFGPR